MDAEDITRSRSFYSAFIENYNTLHDFLDAVCIIYKCLQKQLQYGYVQYVRNNRYPVKKASLEPNYMYPLDHFYCLKIS